MVTTCKRKTTTKEIEKMELIIENPNSSIWKNNHDKKPKYVVIGCGHKFEHNRLSAAIHSANIIELSQLNQTIGA